MEVIMLLLLLGTGLVECQANSDEDYRTLPLAVSSLAVAVALIIILSFISIKADMNPPKPYARVATANPQDVLKVQKAMKALRGSLESFSSELMKTKQKTEIFSISVSALYAESALGLPLQNLHGETKNDAQLYINGILPMHSVLMRSIENFFNQYVSRDFHQWEQYLSFMLNDVRGFRQCCDVLLKLHMEITVRVKKRQDQTLELKAELTNLTEEMERQKMELEISADKKKRLAVFLLFAPSIMKIASPLVYVSAKIDEIRAEANGHENKANRSALAMVNKTMLPFLYIFTHSLNAVAGSCKAIEQDILSFQGQNEKTMKLHREMHYKIMKRQAIKIKQNCTAFLTMIRKVRCDFNFVQHTSLDRSHKIWLNRQLEDIKCYYPEKITGQLRNMLSYDTAATPEQTAIEGNVYG